MRFIIEDNCYNNETVKTITPGLKPFIDSILNKREISSLDYFVIADSSDETFAAAVNKYASLVGSDTYITQDEGYSTAGKSLAGIDSEGGIHQAIVLKSMIWVCAAYEYLDFQGLLKDDILKQMNTPKFMSLAIVLHEIGHTIDNELQFIINGIINTKVFYDLEHEYDEYVKQVALSLWGEYFAESFAYHTICMINESTEGKESDLKKCICTYSFGTDRNTLLNRVYRILYLFITQVAYIHQSSGFKSTFNYSKYEEDELLNIYIPFLAKAEIAIRNLYRNYPNWESYEQLNELSGLFKEFVQFEYRQQSYTKHDD